MIEMLQQAVGRTLIALGVLSVVFGVYAVLHLKSFYARIVVTSKVEAMGFTAIALGAIVLSGISFWAVKLAFILVFELLTVAISSHAIARSAWKSGYHVPTNLTSERPHD